MIDVYLEVGSKKVFAMSRWWPGWGRSGKTADGAIEALAAYRPRYEALVAGAGLVLPDDPFDIVLEIEGGPTTDFGAPGAVPGFDHEQLSGGETARQLALLDAMWRSFHTLAASAPESLTKGPRGGGRDTSKIVEHVDGAEHAYVPKIGVRAGKRPLEELRADTTSRLISLADHPEHTAWPPAYFIRRSAWHVVDHLWEIEDRTPD